MKRAPVAVRKRAIRLLALVALFALIGSVVFWLGTEVSAERHYSAACQALLCHDYASAAERVDACLGLRPNRFRFLFLAAQIARRAGNYAQAQDYLARCRDLAGTQTDVTLLERLLLRAQQGEMTGTEATLWALVEEDHPEKALVLEALARGYRQNYRLPLAEVCLKRLVELDPDYAQAWVWRAEIFDLLGSQQETLRYYERAVELEPDKDDFRLRLALYLLHANLAPQAQEHLQQLRTRQPDNPDILTGLAGCALEAGDPARARQLLKQALANKSDHAGALAIMGRLALHDGDAVRAEVWARRALAAEPSDRAAHYLLFQCLERLGKLLEELGYEF